MEEDLLWDGRLEEGTRDDGMGDEVPNMAGASQILCATAVWSSALEAMLTRFYSYFDEIVVDVVGRRKSGGKSKQRKARGLIGKKLGR